MAWRSLEKYKDNQRRGADVEIFIRGPRMGRWIRRRWVCVFGAPRFSVQRPENPSFEEILLLKGFGAIWGKNLGHPKNADPTMTDPTPHSRPSDLE